MYFSLKKLRLGKQIVAQKESVAKDVGWATCLPTDLNVRKKLLDLVSVPVVNGVILPNEVAKNEFEYRVKKRDAPPSRFLEQQNGDSLALRIVLTLAMTLPMLILYAIGTLGPFLLRDLQLAPGWLGYATMSCFAIAAILSLLAGTVVERIGSRFGLRLLFCTVALSYGLIISVPNLVGLLAAVALCGVAQALCNPVTNLVIAQQVAPAQKAAVVGLKQAGVQLGALFAGLVLPSLALHLGWRWSLAWLIPLALLLACCAPSLVRVHPRAAVAPWRIARPNPLLWRLMAVQACVGIALSVFVTFLPLYATGQGLPATHAGALIAVFGVMGMLSRVLLTPLAARWRDETPLLLALLLFAAAMVGITLLADAQHHWLFWVAASGMGLSAVATNAIAMSMLLRSPVFGGAASASGLLSAAFFGGFALGPVCCGVLANRSFTSVWLALIAVLLLACVVAANLWQARRRLAEGAR